MTDYFAVALTAIVIGLAVGYPILKLCQKLKLRQTILHYVDKHAGKAGTPTLGGFIFIVASIAASAIFLRKDWFVAVMPLIVMLFYALLGFLDDFIKIKFHRNEGLKPWQKLIGQAGGALAVALYTYFCIGGGLNLFGLSIDIGIFIIPFVVFFYVAVTNSVNLLDGLDGLCSGVSLVYLLFFGGMLALMGGSGLSLATVAFAMVGALLAFLVYNGYPAKIFMGDTGSLALGGLIASLAVFSGQELVLPILGLMYVLTALSDIIQVFVYKRTHKRVFKMAPLHHHFEQLGVNENKIVIIYIVVTAVLGLVCIIGQTLAVGVL